MHAFLYSNLTVHWQWNKITFVMRACMHAIACIGRFVIFILLHILLIPVVEYRCKGYKNDSLNDMLHSLDRNGFFESLV